MKLIIKRLSKKNKNKFYLILKKKHKIINIICIINLYNNKMFIKINYNLLLYYYKKFKFNINNFNNIIAVI